MNITIREASDKDLDDLSRLVLSFWQEHSRMIGGTGARKLSEVARQVELFLRSQTTGYFVAEDPGSSRLVAFRRWELHESCYFTRELYVAPDMRRRGVARALIRYFETWLLDKDQDIACITCTPQNQAMITLARAEGYEILNTIEMRKNILDDATKPRDEADALGLKWKVL